MIQRIMQIIEFSKFFLFGPRGSGKSTLLKQSFQGKDVLWINLLDSATELRLARSFSPIFGGGRANERKDYQPCKP